MNVHKNAPLTPKGREAMVRSVVEGGLSKVDAAYRFNIRRPKRSPSAPVPLSVLRGRWPAQRLGRPSFRFGLRVRRPPEFPGFGTRDGPRRPLKRRFRK